MQKKYYVARGGRNIVITSDQSQAILTAGNKPERVFEFSTYSNALLHLKKYVQDAIQHSAKPEGQFIHLDCSINNATGDAEFRVMQSGRYLVSSNLIPHATPNLAEFLALVEAHKYASHYTLTDKIYCDNLTAIKWFKREYEVLIPPAIRLANPKLPGIIEKAVEYVHSQPEGYDQNVEFWDSSLWGQIPSDYKRKASNANDTPQGRQLDN
jgi:hypothetical protein